ncbi:hypothetical protein K438DRAFT_1961673 [Mycena galopus ATCC 62051]|nr:hypothetical protein K438DRAFT_1961673 [Mycena galopus ATCC 62051]
MAALFLYVLTCLLSAGLALSSAISEDGATGLSVARATSDTLDFTTSDWIWTPTTTINALVGLRKDFTPPTGKALIAADIIISADNNLEFFVNGELVVSGLWLNDWRRATRLCVDLLPSFNVFAANASRTISGEGGLIAAMLVTYSDNTTDIIVTDPSWRVHTGLPDGFQDTSFDDTTWSVATSEGTAADFSSMFFPQIPSAITLDVAGWIWTDVVPASGKLPAGSRAFRRTFTPAPNQSPMSADILIAADNKYSLYVNGALIGNGTTWNVAQHYVVNFEPGTTDIVFAVLATNAVASSTAGLIVSAQISMTPTGRTNCAAGAFVVSNGQWTSTTGAIPAGFEQPAFDDSAWPAVVNQEIYGGSVWGTITVAAPSAPVTV